MLTRSARTACFGAVRGSVSAALLVLAIHAVHPAAAGAALTLTGSTPSRYSLAVSPGIAQLWGFFSQPLAPLPPGAVRVSGSMSGLHTGNVIRMDNVIIFENTSGPFFRGETVYVNYRSTITAQGSGEALTGGAFLAFTVSSGPSTAPWSRRIGYDAEDIPYFIYGGDIDNDGTCDVAAPNEGTNNVSVFLNTGGRGAFTTHANYGVGARPSSIFAEDFDNDGDQDMATADINGGTVSVLLNQGDGTFAPRQVLAAGPTCRQVSGGDFDGDNDIDLCATAFGNQRIFLYTNPGNGVYPAGVAFTDVSPGPFGIRTADLNGDAHLDIVVACRTASALNILTNNGTGGFTRTATVASGSWPWDVGVNDQDGDHDCDVVIVAANGNQVVTHFNNGSGAFPSLHAAATGLFPLGVHLADLDGDGDEDVVTSNYTGASVGIYGNPGNGVLAIEETLGTVLAGSYAWAHDLDGDGDLDLSVVDEEADSLFVFYRGSETTGVPAAGGDGGVAAVPPGMLHAVRGEPNPFRPETRITFSLGAPAPVTIAIYDASGVRVATLAAGSMEAGPHGIRWDGRGAGGRELPAGLYLYEVRAGSERRTGKLTLLR